MQQSITFKNAKIHYTDEGQGHAVVLLHGFLENLNMWNDLKPHLLNKHRVVTIDLLGHGKTECLGYMHAMETMAEAVYAVLRQLRLRRITLIGHSMGGYVSLAFTESHPEMIKALCLMNSTAYADSEDKKRNRDRAIEAVKQNHKTFVRLALPGLFAEGNGSLHKTEIKNLIEEALKMSTQGIIAAIEGMKQRPDRSMILQSLSANKMIIAGKQDPVLDYNAIKKLSEDTNSLLVGFPDGHMSHIENIEEFTYKIMRFIEK